MRMRCAALVSSGLLVWGNAWGAPAIVTEPQTFNWGRQAENKGEYAYTIAVKNAGDEELQITNIRAGCSCTKVDMKKKNLAPGESTEMTGTLTTKGVEGVMQKAIILTTNDPLNQTTMVTLAIRFPVNGEGVRIKYSPVVANWRDGALVAYVTVENCEPNTPAKIEAMELPEGWDSPQALPITIAPEDRTGVILTRKAEVKSEVAAFDALPFALITDSAKTPRLKGALAYTLSAPAHPLQAPPGPPAAAPGTTPTPLPGTAAPPAPPAPAAPSATPEAGAKPAP